MLVADLERVGASINQVFRLWGINPAGDQRGGPPLGKPHLMVPAASCGDIRLNPSRLSFVGSVPRRQQRAQGVEMGYEVDQHGNEAQKQITDLNPFGAPDILRD